MNDLVVWFQAQLDEDERSFKELERGDRTPVERRLIRALQDKLASDQRCLDQLVGAIEEEAVDPNDETRAADVSTLTWIVEDRALGYAKRPGYRQEWRPSTA